MNDNLINPTARFDELIIPLSNSLPEKIQEHEPLNEESILQHLSSAKLAGYLPSITNQTTTNNASAD
jgi:hypothetical protein